MHRVSVPRLLGLFITVCAVLLPLATPAGAEVRWTGTTG
jgi:hypothetical protein